jgi:hypothetical protein
MPLAVCAASGMICLAIKRCFGGGVEMLNNFLDANIRWE